MNKMKYVLYATIAIALMAVVAAAQPGGAGAADNESTVSAAKAIGGGIGFGLAAGLAGIGQGLVGSRAAEGAARNPGARVESVPRPTVDVPSRLEVPDPSPFAVAWTG